MRRREFIASAAGIALASILPPARAGFLGFGRRRGCPSQATFDYYISTTGSDSNAGTLAAPWAITSLQTSSANWSKIDGTGKSIGLVGGTYNVAALMANDAVTGALQVPGGNSSSAVTYLASCDSNGIYSARAATIDAAARASFTADISGTSSGTSTMTVTSGVSGTIVIGMGIYGTGIPFGAYISAGSGTSWTISFTSSTIATALSGVSVSAITFGGFNSTGSDVYDGPVLCHGGKYPSPYTTSNLVIDGITFTGYNFKGVMIGNTVAGITNVTIKNCLFTGAGFNPSDAQDNCTGIWVDSTNGVLVTNNGFYNNIGHAGPTNPDHLSGIFITTTQSVNTQNTTVEYNTLVNSSDIYGKENNVESSIVQYNYVDCSMYPTGGAMNDFTGAPASGLSGTTIFRGNICITQASVMTGGPTLSNSYGYTTPVECYNNTYICSGGTTGAIVDWMTSTGGYQFYNNIYVPLSNQTSSFNGFGNIYTNPAAISVMDYNLYPSAAGTMTWSLYENSSYTTAIASYTMPSAFATGLAANGGISGAEAHSITGTPTFTGTGTLAQQYKLASGSIGKGVGSTGNDMGAWGCIDVNTGQLVSQIGCNFAL